MSEAAPNNPQYLEHHPDAIQDPAKAEYMAIASHVEEEKVAELKQKALGHAALLHEGGYNSNDYDGRQAIKQAEVHRKEADYRANQAAVIYDGVKKL